ncbi:hypothetical protein CATMQ487_03750 [Sphaerotilus microaerophilus]|uniref:YecA family protein n=1 Tax=Sphaerotilus microaerophilus TaxID=2914710 RepID=A0ABN6PJQ3_9BURK|nr:hypothetical protein CATMQ487_03750 [Sphaerotilus sp. FB-5]
MGASVPHSPHPESLLLLLPLRSPPRRSGTGEIPRTATPCLNAVKHPQYNPALDNPPLTDVELDQLDALLARLPSAPGSDGAMDIEGLDGYLTALLLSPRLPAADDWLPRVWGGTADSEPPFVSGKQTKRVVQLVLRHMASIHRQLQADVDQLQPFFAIAERQDGGAAAVDGADGEDGEADDDGFWVDAGNWCTGFLLATELQPAAWAPLFEEPEAAELLQPIVLLGADPSALDEADRARLADVAQRDRLSRQVPDIVSALWQQQEEPQQEPQPESQQEPDEAQ